MKSEVGEQPRGANIPRIRKHKHLADSVKIAELLPAPDPPCTIHARSNLPSYEHM